MKERPILFNDEMVRAILDGRKTQTRRVIKKLPCSCGEWLPYELCPETPEGWQGAGHSGNWSCECCGPDEIIKCPFGIPGDRLWVREGWRVHFMYDDLPPREINQKGWQEGDGIQWRAGGQNKKDISWGKWRVSIHMPRWASRILLEITDIRVERVQDISTADVSKEGINECRIHKTPHVCCSYLKDEFEKLWNSINEATGFGWDKDPWVWVVEFRRIK